MVLPLDNQSVGYSRFCIQSTFTEFTCSDFGRNSPEAAASASSSSGSSVRKFGFKYVWLVDDLVAKFSYLEHLNGATDGDTKAVKKRVECTFWEAMTAAQDHMTPQTCLAGFLRDDGTACCKTQSIVADNPSLWKILFMNLDLMKRQHCFYCPYLKKWEDVHLCNKVLRTVPGGQRTLKFYHYAFTALNLKSGGCDKERNTNARLTFEDCIDPHNFCRLPANQRGFAVDLFKWATSKER